MIRLLVRRESQLHLRENPAESAFLSDALADFPGRHPAEWQAVVESERLREIAEGTGTLGRIEQPLDLAQVLVIYLVSRPVLIDQVTDVLPPRPTGGPRRRATRADLRESFARSREG